VADANAILIAFEIEDERQRDFVKGQSLDPRALFESVDMSVNEPDWKDKRRTHRPDGVMVLTDRTTIEWTARTSTASLSPSRSHA
jgi:hypothetical protein